MQSIFKKLKISLDKLKLIYYISYVTLSDTPYKIDLLDCQPHCIFVSD